VIGAVATWMSLGSRDTDWSFYTPTGTELGPPGIVRWFGPLLLAIAGLLYAGHLAAIIVRAIGSAGREKLAIALAFVLAIAFACTMGLLDVISARDPFFAPTFAPYALAATTAAALVLATAALVGERGLTLALLAIAGATLWAFVPFFVLGLGVLGLWIALAMLGGFRRPAGAFVVFGAGPAIAVLSLARVLSSATDVHLHDTHYQVGTYHLVGAITVFGGLAALHAWPVFRRGAHLILVWIGAITCSAGMLLHAAATLRLGTSGMPRRYWDYEPSFTEAHRIAGVGALILVGGLLVLGIAWLVGDRRRPPGVPSAA
jgi:hypothetical protein